MDNITKILSDKIVIIVTTLVLTMAYIGLATVYAEGLTNNINTKTESYGRNASANINDLVREANPDNILQIKQDLEQKLQQANLILNIIEQQKETSKHGVMN